MTTTHGKSEDEHVKAKAENDVVAPAGWMLQFTPIAPGSTVGVGVATYKKIDVEIVTVTLGFDSANPAEVSNFVAICKAALAAKLAELARIELLLKTLLAALNG